MQMADLPGFVERLKRHHMFRVASWYATAAYVLILVANAVFPDIGLTRGEVRYLIAGLALGFPLALVIGWTFVSPSREDPEKHSQWQRARWRVGPALSIVVVLFVASSGTYLWDFNARHGDPAAEMGKSSAQVLAILPFEHSGAVDDAFMADLADLVSTSFSSVGVRLIAGNSSPLMADPKASIADIAKATGATLVLKGSVQRADAKADYDFHFELISTADGVTLDSRKLWWSGKAAPEDVQRSIATIMVARVQFLGVLDHYFAPGYPTTKDPAALQLFRHGMLTYMYGDYVDGMQMLRAAVKLDPGFAQVHAYIAFFEALNPEDGITDPKALVDQEIATAEAKVPGLPEAAMARAASQYSLQGDSAGAAATLKPVAAELQGSYNLHMLQGYTLRDIGHWQDALREYHAAVAMNPYSAQGVTHYAKLGLGLRNYADMEKYLKSQRALWPLSPKYYLNLAQVQLSEDGDFARFAQVVGGDFSAYGVDPTWPMLALLRLETAHFQGKHAEVIRGLKSIKLPGGCADTGYDFPQLSVQGICTDQFMTESLRLAGKDQEAAAFAKLHAPQWAEETPGFPGDLKPAVDLALLQAFGDDRSALQTLEPLFKRLDKPVAQWNQRDGSESLDAAVALAWCGEKQKAVDMLAKSLDATFGAHAALVARDPVWRPLYKYPAFTALLAAHGETLTHAL